MPSGVFWVESQERKIIPNEKGNKLGVDFIQAFFSVTCEFSFSNIILYKQRVSHKRKRGSYLDISIRDRLFRVILVRLLFNASNAANAGNDYAKRSPVSLSAMRGVIVSQDARRDKG